MEAVRKHYTLSSIIIIIIAASIIIIPVYRLEEKNALALWPLGLKGFVARDQQNLSVCTRVRNNANVSVDVLFWSRFDAATPFCGHFTSSKGESGYRQGATKCGIPVEMIPDSTVVYWLVEGSDVEYHQELDLSVFPHLDVGGVLVFELGADNKWRVSLERP